MVKLVSIGTSASLALTLALTAAPGPARAQGEQDVYGEEASFSHKGQIGVHLQAGAGYRGVFPYNEEYCGQLDDDGSNKPDCLARSPFALDLGVAYGLLDLLEVMVELRVGLERDFGPSPGAQGPRELVVSPGIKGYIAEVGATRFFSTLQIPLDFTDYKQLEGTDIGVRNINGFQLDLHRTMGIFFFFGETASWKRWLQFEIEAGIGLQARFP